MPYLFVLVLLVNKKQAMGSVSGLVLRCILAGSLNLIKCIDIGGSGSITMLWQCNSWNCWKRCGIELD